MSEIESSEAFAARLLDESVFSKSDVAEFRDESVTFDQAHASALLTAYLARRDAAVREAAIRECVAECCTISVSADEAADEANEEERYEERDYFEAKKIGAEVCTGRLRTLLPTPPAEQKGGEHG